MTSDLATSTFFVGMVLINAIACVFLFYLPALSSPRTRGAVWYFRSYFVAVCLANIAILMRDLLPLWLSVFIANVLYVVAAYCVLFGNRWRNGRFFYLYKHPVVLHIFGVSFVQMWLVYVEPQNLTLRLMFLYINLMVIYAFAIGEGYQFETRSKANVNVLNICLLISLVSIVGLPVSYFWSRSSEVFFYAMMLTQCMINVVLFGAFYSTLLFDEIHRHQENALTDPLTGLYNRRYFFEQANKFLKAATRHHFPISIVICDLDHFKQINDNYGHAAGDEAICKFAEQMRDVVREDDLVARYGGEEFIAMLPRTAVEGAEILADRLRKQTADIALSSKGQTVTLTASFGVTSLDHYMDIEMCIQAADRALYRAKRNGRNQVCCDDISTLVV